MTGTPAKGPSRKQIERVAGALGVREGFIEKDWHVTQVLKALQSVELEGLHLVFGGGTSLSKAHGIIQRFSEDIDLRVVSTNPADVPGRSKRDRFRAGVESALAAAGYSVDAGRTVRRHQNKMFGFLVPYERIFPIEGLRPDIQIEISFEELKMAVQPCDVQSFISKAAGSEPEIKQLRCVAAVETAADKLAALSWRVYQHKDLPEVRSEGEEGPLRDRSLVRHVHDLCALEAVVNDSGDFVRHCRDLVIRDGQNRGQGTRADRPEDPQELLGEMCRFLRDPPFPEDYALFVQNLVYGKPVPEYSVAVEALERIARLLFPPKEATLATDEKNLGADITDGARFAGTIETMPDSLLAEIEDAVETYAPSQESGPA